MKCTYVCNNRGGAQVVGSAPDLWWLLRLHLFSLKHCDKQASKGEAGSAATHARTSTIDVMTSRSMTSLIHQDPTRYFACNDIDRGCIINAHNILRAKISIRKACYNRGKTKRGKLKDRLCTSVRCKRNFWACSTQEAQWCTFILPNFFCTTSN